MPMDFMSHLEVTERTVFLANDCDFLVMCFMCSTSWTLCNLIVRHNVHGRYVRGRYDILNLQKWLGGLRFISCNEVIKQVLF